MRVTNDQAQVNHQQKIHAADTIFTGGCRRSEGSLEGSRRLLHTQTLACITPINEPLCHNHERATSVIGSQGVQGSFSNLASALFERIDIG
jgi:hypothetical protein